MNWLFKEEPTHYSFDDLARDGKTSWTGVKNPLAQKHLRGVKKGDQIFLTAARRPGCADPTYHGVFGWPASIGLVVR